MFDYVLVVCRNVIVGIAVTLGITITAVGAVFVLLIKGIAGGK